MTVTVARRTDITKLPNPFGRKKIKIRKRGKCTHTKELNRKLKVDGIGLMFARFLLFRAESNQSTM